METVERDHMYESSLQELPFKIDNRRRVPIILDQGREGACSGSRRSSRPPPPGATATRRSACGTWARARPNPCPPAAMRRGHETVKIAGTHIMPMADSGVMATRPDL